MTRTEKLRPEAQLNLELPNFHSPGLYRSPILNLFSQDLIRLPRLPRAKMILLRDGRRPLIALQEHFDFSRLKGRKLLVDQSLAGAIDSFYRRHFLGYRLISAPAGQRFWNIEPSDGLLFTCMEHPQHVDVQRIQKLVTGVVFKKDLRSPRVFALTADSALGLIRSLAPRRPVRVDWQNSTEIPALDRLALIVLDDKEDVADHVLTHVALAGGARAPDEVRPRRNERYFSISLRHGFLVGPLARRTR